MKAAAVLLCCALVCAAEKCERISAGLCQNLGYNSTMMPNFMGHDSQINADLGLRVYKSLLNHDCSKHIRLFVCSVFVPLCSEHVPGPIPACKGLCEKVKGDCSGPLEAMGHAWPPELNCSGFPEPPEMCMQQPTEEVQVPRYFNHDDNAFSANYPPNRRPSGAECAPIFAAKHGQMHPDEVSKFEIWVAVWSTICLIFTVFALITFIIQPKRFRWPARPILYLTSCGFITCTIYLIRWIEGPYTYNGTAAIEKPSESPSCVVIALILLFCDIAYALWWTVFCFVWFLSAMKEWSTEAIEKISTRLHAVVWMISSIPMFYVLMSNNIGNSMSGFCEVKTKTLIFFQLFFMVLSSVLAVLTSFALKNVRRTLISAGRSPLKLERLFYRLLAISLGISVPYFVYLWCQFYHTFAWGGSYDSFTIAVVQLVSRKISILFATLWVYSPKTFHAWRNFVCFCELTSDDAKNRRSNDLGCLFPKCFGNSGDGVAKINGTALINNSKNAVLIEKKTIFDIFFASTSGNAPVSRV
ncbi:frizzled-4-like [Cylas formicarius]|uniref:frizzled-4-like n=1 Tax=Cylas formicarius TaxID=197179 RepID=UPI002958B711|nr:frizzled-4-like [Cylas formicarius]